MTSKNAVLGSLKPGIRAVCFDWGGTLMSEVGPQDRAMCFWPEVQRLDGALECLQALQPHFTLCIATNATISHHHHIERALQRGGIAHFFHHIFCHMDLGVKKDHPAFWDAVAHRLELAPAQIAMVGDSLAFDAIAPRRFGVQAFWLNPAAHAASMAADLPADVPQVASLGAFATRLLSVAP